MVVRIRKTHGGKGKVCSVDLWLCKGPVAREHPAQGAPGTGRAGEVERVAACFSKCRVEGEQRGRGCHTMKGLTATWKDWAVF